MNLLSILDGYKTYILVAVAFVLWLGLVAKLWTLDQIDELFGLLTIFGVGALRSALTK